ncbi:Nse4 protein [Candida orthopsilosis Co 90-125]|uniref:Non-structural maintenance of chromosomes element 4 n=1 Tax=Candida orthopsilosis (strain 90-125) TaxID=1136231 RepID=H8X6U6_CANO9|nr:Nse4 protein [Candida orthopsilosis Co 90-125]CCG23707.1 Nse4 protein [Candida orthopsilosis Co 90-125]
MSSVQTETSSVSKAKLTKQDHLNAYNKLRQRMKNQLKLAAKGEGSALSLSNIEELKRLYNALEKEKVRDTKIHLEDSEVFKEASDFAALNARNLRFGEGGIALDERDVLKRLRKYAATDSSILSDIVKEDQDGGDAYGEGNEDEDEELITDEYTFNKVNWLKLGVLYHQISKKPISVDFLNGPLANEKKRATNRTRNIDDTRGGRSTTARHVEASDVAQDEEKNTAYMVRLVYDKYLKKESKEEINFFKFFINPHSFAQSVENLFYTSFLIKDGRLKLYTGKSGVPCISRVSQKELEQIKLDSSNILSSHHIATFNYDVWQYFIQELDIKEAFLGHREGIEDQVPAEDFFEDFGDEELELNDHSNETDTTNSSTTTTPSFDE